MCAGNAEEDFATYLTRGDPRYYLRDKQPGHDPHLVHRPYEARSLG